MSESCHQVGSAQRKQLSIRVESITVLEGEHPADRGQVAPLATGATSFDESVPTWSRDGRWIYFSSTRSGTTGIWKMPSAGGSAVPDLLSDYAVMRDQARACAAR